jgi:hypothetical protein
LVPIGVIGRPSPCGLGPKRTHRTHRGGVTPQAGCSSPPLDCFLIDPSAMRTDEDLPIRGEVRVAGFQRISHGLFMVERAGLSPEEDFRRELRAWQLVLPPGAVYTHVTAARLRRWQLPPLPERVPVFAAVHAGDRRPRRAGLICSRLVEGAQEPLRLCQGMPVDTPEEILLRCARDLGHLDLVVLVDSARRVGDVDPVMMEAILSSRRPGTRALAAAYQASHPGAESPGESLLRRFHDIMHVPVEPQVELRDGDGRPIGRADLLLCGRRDVHEYDGAGHRSSHQHRSDLRRDRRLAQSGYTRRGFTLDDLVNHPAVAMHELDRMVGRKHDPRRLRRWCRMMEESLYSPIGRRRILNRWRRAMGVVDWA